MALNNTNPSKTAAWEKLAQHYKNTKDTDLKELFANDSGRGKDFTIQWNDPKINIHWPTNNPILSERDA